MSDAPLLAIFRAAIVGPYYSRRAAARGTLRAYLAPGDAYDLAREVGADPRLRSIAFRSIGPMVEEWAQNLFGVRVSVQSGVVDGWMMLENDAAPKGMAISMHRMRCHDHEECRGLVEMARLCEEDRLRDRRTMQVPVEPWPPQMFGRGW